MQGEYENEDRGEESSGKNTHLPPPITIQIIPLDNLDAFSLFERDLVFVLWFEIVESINEVWHSGNHQVVHEAVNSGRSPGSTELFIITVFFTEYSES